MLRTRVCKRKKNPKKLRLETRLTSTLGKRGSVTLVVVVVAVATMVDRDDNSIAVSTDYTTSAPTLKK